VQVFSLRNWLLLVVHRGVGKVAARRAELLCGVAIGRAPLRRVAPLQLLITRPETEMYFKDYKIFRI
jgi:hypothetical protein